MKEMSNSSLLKTALLAGSLLFGTAGATVGEEADARKILVSMTEYVSSLDALSFDFEEYHEIVTGDGETLGLAASGSVALVGPDKIRVLRRTGYTDTDLAFDGQILSLTDSDAGLFARHALPGTLDHLIDTLRDDFARPLPDFDQSCSRSRQVALNGSPLSVTPLEEFRCVYAAILSAMSRTTSEKHG